MLSLALLTEIGATQVAWAADALGRPDLPEPKVSQVEEVTGLGAEKARALVTKDQERNDEQSRRARAEQTSTEGPGHMLRSTGPADGTEQGEGGGDYSATPLAESASWAAGGNSGSFTWDYGIDVPEAPAGPVPELSLNYDSGSIDGRTSTTNNQGTTVGEGFALTESYIERSYGACKDDGHGDEERDLCWKYDNARLVLNGKSSRLVKDGSSWRLSNDDAAQVARHTGADNGDDNGEYWTVTTGEGTKYTFGKDDVAGEDTDSVWTVPVYGDDSGEPGYSKGDSFGDRWLRQAWRWNLDVVQDTHGNAMSQRYGKETNHYRKNGADTANTAYTRGGYLKEVRYGQRIGALDQANYRVKFSYSARCTVGDCTELTEDSKDHWPDVPFDALCTDGEAEADCIATGPSFFTKKRLTGITTQVKDGESYQDIDAWKLTQEYLDGGDIGDTSDHVLTLTSVERTGKVGEDITLNPVEFTYHMRPNRVDATDDILPITRPRLSTITTETGGITTVTYSDPECRRSEVLGEPEDTNTRNCYPQYWHPNGASEASVDWFHKYRVLAVVNSDPTGHNEAVEHSYTYQDAAWHYSDSPFTKKEERTWSDWRGYRKVTEHTGAQETTRSKKVSLYMQGMDGDKTEGGTREVEVPGLDVSGLDVADLTDANAYSGKLREEITYNGDTPTTVTVNTPWTKETARQDVPGAGDHVARYVRDKTNETHTYLTAEDAWRSRSTSTSYDSYGMASAVSDSGQVGKSGDETCKRTWYARNPSKGLTNLVSRERTVGRACTVSEAELGLPENTDSRGEVLSDTATVYDDADASGWTPDQTPTKGEATWTGRPTGYPATTSSGERHPAEWQTVSTTGYDTLGRATSTTDAAGHTSTTSYTPAEGGPVTRKGTVNARGHKTWTFYETLRGLPVRSYDVNAKKTEQAYDALGRLTGVWLPNRSRDSKDSPSYQFGYHLNNEKPSVVSTGKINSDGTTFTTTYTLYDALLRDLQTQTPTPHGGRLLTDTRYDTRGKAYETYADIFDTTSTPNGTYTRAEHGRAPRQTVKTFDGAGRETASTLLVFGTEKWTTRTSYTGDSVATTARDGGSAKRTITDIRGNTVERRDYAGPLATDPGFGGASPGVSYSSTSFTHTLDGKKKAVTGPDGADWSYSYDLHGRETRAEDPDSGASTMEYDELDQPVKVTDARGKSVLTGYDEIGRVTGTWKGEKTEANRLTSRTWDTVLKGKPASSTRHTDDGAYTKRVTEYDTLDHPVERELELPADDPLVAAGAPRTMVFESQYTINGLLRSTIEPGMGGLQEEAVSYDYTDLGLLEGIGGSTGYLQGTSYTPTSQVQQLTLGTGGSGNKNTYLTHTYEEGTGRLTRSHVTDQTHSWMLQDLRYGYDDAGNVTSVKDPTTIGGAQAADAQCFAYDGHRRLTEAWTPAGGECADPRSADALGGRAPYWNSYTYDEAGLRTSETDHVGDQERAYCYSGGQPHTLDGISTAGDCSTEPETAYGYDASGNTTTRPEGQQLSWNHEGKLETLTDGVTETGYLYDADGELLIRDTAGGERILYAGSTELHLTSDGTQWAQRYYGTGETTVALRSNAGGDSELSYLVADKHRTATLAVDAGDEQTFVKRSLSPFGAERTAAGVGDWVDDKAFLGKPRDTTTGLTHIGAREYDPGTGMFLSVDPLLELDKPQTLNGYSYGGQNPYTFTDPTGMGLACGGAGRSHIGCGTGTVTHADGSLSKNGNPTGGGIIKGGGALTHGTPPGGCAAIRCHSGGGPGQAYGGAPSGTASPSHLNTDSGKSAKKNSENKAWYEKIGGLFKDHWRTIAAAEITVLGFAGGAVCAASVVCAVVVGAAAGAAAYAVSSAGTKNWNTTDLIITAAGGGMGGRVAGKYAGPTATVIRSRIATKASLRRLEKQVERMRKEIYGN